MDTFKVLVFIFVGSAIVNNFVLSKFLGICPFLGVSKKVETSIGMGGAVAFVMVLASAITYIIKVYIMDNLQKIMPEINVNVLQTIIFILVIASLVQFVEIILKRFIPSLYQSLGVFLPLITTNCAVLGVTIMNMDESYNLLESIINSLGAAVGFTIAIVLFAGIRERLEMADVPKTFKGYPISLITAGLLSLVFLGFSSLFRDLM